MIIMTVYQAVLLAAVLAVTSCQSPPVVNTPSGPIKGIVVPALEKDVLQFRNIPYAKPPIGNLRFEKTVPIEPWTETLDGTAFGPSCLQDINVLPELWENADNNITSEDCLQLNVYVPGAVSTTSKKPVMFWIHGGGFQVGNGWSLDPSFLVLKDVIVVTINYRLGVFGFLSTGDVTLPGNYGIWDMIEALKWVNKNIASFGGDPESVTIFGESAGGFAVSYLSVIPSNEGLFRRIIPQSGSGMGEFWDVTNALASLLRELVHILAASLRTTRQLTRALLYFPWSRGAGHGVELLYMCGPRSLNELDESLSSPEGRKMTEILVNYWTNFAKTGNPNGDNLVEWKKFGPDGRHFMNLNMEPFLDQDLFPKRMKLLLEDIPNKLKKNGPIKGIVVPALAKDVVQFRNIPYAKPPIGKLRFEKTVPIEPWTETLDGTAFGPSCLQDINFFPELWEKADNNITSEDCLQLNVYVPGAVSTTSKKPVMFWIHGGGFQIGNGWSLDPSFLVLKDVIVVTINYRLGVFGFLSTGDVTLPGNYGIWDMIEALKWVNKNIASFGGDPESVTIFGQSAGGFAVSYLSVIPSNEGLFRRIIPQSGSGMGEFWDVRNALQFTKRIGTHIGCITENDSTVDKSALIVCLKEKPADDLFKAQNDPATADLGEIPISPVLWPNVDGELFVKRPSDSLQDLTSKESIFFRSLDVMAGTTDNEASLFPFIIMKLQESRNFNFSDGIPTSVLCDDIAPAIAQEAFKGDIFASELLCKAYTEENLDEQSRSAANLWGDIAFVAPTVQLLDFHSRGRANSNTYQYLFTQAISFHFLVPSFPWSRGAGHGVELLYMCGPRSLNELDESLSSPEGRKMTEILVNYWTNFAKTGNPNGDNLVEWKNFGPDGRHFMNLNMEPFLDQDLFPKRMKLLLEDIPNKLKKNVKTEL
ncbi:carboxylesterase 1C-like [Pecten maximus]|uniref:carboxylesterase 1C-like n=1 Tax=Pecten maximus TaxID=6579 RepID=UPI00145835D4|nr:carboxylesterase 1C-like [Pecten maximus]